LVFVTNIGKPCFTNVSLLMFLIAQPGAPRGRGTGLGQATRFYEKQEKHLVFDCYDDFSELLTP
jgi:hypothetical protein